MPIGLEDEMRADLCLELHRVISQGPRGSIQEDQGGPPIRLRHRKCFLENGISEVQDVLPLPRVSQLMNLAYLESCQD